MALRKKTLLSMLTSVLLVSLIGCFPTNTDDKDKLIDPTDVPQDIINDDDPTDLPEDIDPAADISEKGIDSMFNVLISRVESLESTEKPSDLYGIDFSSLRRGFSSAIVNNPSHVKANIGFIVSSVLSLNANPDLQKMIDSLSQYIDDMSEYNNPEDPNDWNYGFAKKSASAEAKPVSFLSKTYSRHGLLSAGQILVGAAPKMLLAQTRPSFPSFLTAAYIQNMIESAIVPNLDEVIAATQRLTAVSDMSIEITVDNETGEIDKGDIYILEAMVRAARAGFSMVLIYDMDVVQLPGSTNAHYIDDVLDYIDNAEYVDGSIINFSLNNDTLVINSFTDNTSSIPEDYCDFMQYNYKRPGFLSIRKAYHTAVYNDLKAIPSLIKSGLNSISNESDNQNNDIFPSTDIMDMSSEMADVSAEMIEEGFTTAFANNFSSPENLMDFISLLLTQPYTFNETIDGKSITLKVDLSKFFTSPAAALTDYWPKHVFPTGDDRFTTFDFTGYREDYSDNSISIYKDEQDSIKIDIPESAIDNIEDGGYYIEIFLKEPYVATVNRYSVKTISPIIYVDDNGKAINYLGLIEGEDPEQCFPYFDDYTMRGIFPDMTSRQKWIDFIRPLIE